MRFAVFSMVIASVYMLGVRADQLQELSDSVRVLRLQCQSRLEDDRQIINYLKQQINDVRHENELTKKEVLDVRRQNEILLEKILNLDRLYESLQIKYHARRKRDTKNIRPLGQGSSRKTVPTTARTTPSSTQHWLGFGDTARAATSRTTTPAGLHWLGFGNHVTVGTTGATGTPCCTTSLQSTKGQKGDVGPQGPQGATGPPGPKGDAAFTLISNRVAFYATLRNTVNVNLGMTLIFQNVVTNEGNRYNPTTGVFTCGVPGIYVFSWSICVGKDDFVNTELVKNGQMVNMQFTSGTDKYEISTSHMTVLSLQTNDRVNVMVYRNPSPQSFTIGDATTFSGFLLFSF
ncbi:adiponectin-like [Ylistrum balloti]|uniref:adiponectin-like n=1 Tax=Ylistrum balloti TaxID=509963 RepID=UPI002905E188|nr:adiponectin-like [Ylistrum balloti]